MLLSTFISFLLARRFSKKTCLVLIIVTSVLISFLSAFGWITIHQRLNPPYEPTIYYYELHPIPLSFPFYASAFLDLPNIPFSFDLCRINYKIDFLTAEIISDRIYYYAFTFGNAFSYYSFFLLVNIVGAAVGYLTARRHK